MSAKWTVFLAKVAPAVLPGLKTAPQTPFLVAGNQAVTKVQALFQNRVNVDYLAGNLRMPIKALTQDRIKDQDHQDREVPACGERICAEYRRWSGCISTTVMRLWVIGTTWRPPRQRYRASPTFAINELLGGLPFGLITSKWVI